MNKTWLLKVLLVCGFISSILYIGSDIAASMRYEGYSYVNQSFSELLAIGSPVRSFMIPLMVIYNLLVLAFGAGVWKAAGQKLSLRITAVLLLAYGATSFLGPFVPMHVRGAGFGLTDALHIICVFILVLSVLLAMGFGAATGGKIFRFYSFASIAAVISFGILAGMQGPRIAAGLPTPWLGVIERSNIYPIMLWVLLLAVVLLREKKEF